MRRLARIATPSVSDCFFIALIVWLFISGASGWISLLGDGDTGWHIRTGQYILEQHSVPTRDLFSFSRPGAPWFAWEWLTDVTYAVSFQLGGLKAIVLLAGAMIALFATLILRYTLWRGANALVAAFTTLLAVGASSMHFLARPHLFTLLLLPVCLWVVEADRRENTRWLWALIPLTALWTNLHGGFVIFLACLGLLLLAYGIEMALAARVNQPWRELPGWPQIRRYATLLAGCSLASLANPYGYQLHVHILEYLRADWIKNIVQEFQAPTFRSEGQLQFEVLLLAGLIASGFLIRRRLFAEALWSELHDKGVDVLGLILGKTNTPALRRLEHSRGHLSSEDTAPQDADSVEQVITEAFENLSNGPTLMVGDMMRAVAPMLASLTRNEAVKLFAQAQAAAMGGE